MNSCKRVKNIVKNEKGTMAIEITIGTLMFLMCFVVIVDLMVITWKSNLASQVSTRVAREVGIQGGYGAKAPEFFPGGNNSYTTNIELHEMLMSHFKAYGIADDAWKVTIYPERYPNQKTVYSADSSPTTNEAYYDYKAPIIIETTIKYTWEMSKGMLPFLDKYNSLSSKRATISEWRFNYDDWEDE